MKKSERFIRLIEPSLYEMFNDSSLAKVIFCQIQKYVMEMAGICIRYMKIVKRYTFQAALY